MLEDHLALIVHHVVVLEHVLAGIEVARLDLLLRLLEGLVDPGVGDGLAFLQPQLLQHAVHAVRAEDAHQVVFERQIELGAAGIALAAGAAAQLVVDAPALVALGAQHVEAAGVDRLLLLRGDVGLDVGALGPDLVEFLDDGGALDGEVGSAGLAARGLLLVGPGAAVLAHEAEQRFVDGAEAPLAIGALLPLAGFCAQRRVRPALQRVGIVAIVPARLNLGVLPGDLGTLFRDRSALGLDGQPLLGNLLGAGLSARGGLLLGPVGERGLDPFPEAAVDPLVAGVEDIVDPLPQRLEAVAGIVHGAHATCIDLLLQPVAGAIAVVAAELDVGAAARHVGGDRHRARHAGLGDDVRFLLVVAGVEHLVRNGIAAVLLGKIDQIVADLVELRLELVLLAGLEAVGLLLEVLAELADVLAVAQQPGQLLRFLDRGGADQNGLAAAVAFGDLGDDGARFLLDGAVDLVVLVGAIDRPVGGDLEHVEPVDIEELVGLGHGRAGHAGELLVEPEVVLEGDGGERLVLGLDLDVLLGLQRLVQAFGIAPALHHASRELVDDDDLAALDDVVAVALEQLVGLQRLVGVVHHRDALDVVERSALEQVLLLQQLLHALVAGLGEGGLALLLVELDQPLGLEQLLLQLLPCSCGSPASSLSILSCSATRPFISSSTAM